MAVQSGMFPSIGGDRKVKASFFANYFASFVGNGVFLNPSNNLQVVSHEQMKTVIKAGKGWINGYFVENDSDFILTHDIADGVLKRYDRIVMRLNHETRDINFFIKKGTFANLPVAPTLQRDSLVYELALADVFIGNGVTEITQATITDLRLNNSLCGEVHGIIDQVDTTTIFNQYQAWLEQKQSEYNDDFLTWTTQQQESFNLWRNAQEADFEDWTVAQQEAFENWLEEIQDLLDENTAANLTNRVEQLEARSQVVYDEVTNKVKLIY